MQSFNLRVAQRLRQPSPTAASAAKRRQRSSAATLSTLASPPEGFVAMPGMEQGKFSRVLFFTGKGGVGKTALSCATSLALADSGRRVLLISTDPASNLDEMFQHQLSNSPTAITGAPNLFAMNINPHEAAEEYRARVIAPLVESGVEKQQIDKVREQLSGACTIEVATFDEFSRLMTGEDKSASSYDHVIFDTAPTGHTLRLLSLPLAWTGFLGSAERAASASCLGPHSGLASQQLIFKSALDSLQSPQNSTVVLVARPDRASLREAARTYSELRALQISHQHLAINGLFKAASVSDPVALAYEKSRSLALTMVPEVLRSLPQWNIPLRPYNMVGLPALRSLLKVEQPPTKPVTATPATRAPVDISSKSLRVFVDNLLSQRTSGLLMFMGKGGVGKTTIAAAVALELAKRGFRVTLTTTDPAAHLVSTLEASDSNDPALKNLSISRIDPVEEVKNYTKKVVESREPLSKEARDLLIEDLKSPCTEEVAVFHSFARLVSKSASLKNEFVVLDTAPTGHTLLLLDTTGSYHRDMIRAFAPEMVSKGRVVTPLIRLRDPKLTAVYIVTLPEPTPVTEASFLQEDLRRAGIEPQGWIINNGLTGQKTSDPILCARMDSEAEQIARVEAASSTGRIAIVPWQTEEPVGVGGLQHLLAD